MIEAWLSSFGLVFLAELGDRSMLLAVALAARYRPTPVLGGIAIAALTMLGAATLLGAGVGALIDGPVLSIGSGLLFLGFGVWTLLDREDEDDEGDGDLRGATVLLGVTAAFLLAEFGDKTMLATIALAGTQPALPTWLGASAGMFLASAIAVALAMTVGRRLSAGLLRRVAGGAFLLFGVLLLVDGLRG